MSITELFKETFAELSWNWKPNTLARYFGICNQYLEPYFREMFPEKISQNEIDSYCAFLMATPLSPATQTLVLVFSQKMFRKLAERFPHLKKIHFRFPKAPLRPVQIMKNENARILFQALMDKNDSISIGLLLSLCTGIRLSELCGLRHGDFDFQAECFRISRIYHRIQSPGEKSKTKLIFEVPKTPTSFREIPLPICLCQKMSSKNLPADFYILTGSTKPMEPRLLNYHFSKIQKELKIPYSHFHILRHTYATRAMETGTDARTLAEILGHANVKTTLSLYVHPSLNHKRKCLAHSLSSLAS